MNNILANKGSCFFLATYYTWQITTHHLAVKYNQPVHWLPPPQPLLFHHMWSKTFTLYYYANDIDETVWWIKKIKLKKPMTLSLLICIQVTWFVFCYFSNSLSHPANGILLLLVFMNFLLLLLPRPWTVSIYYSCPTPSLHPPIHCLSPFNGC